MPRDSIIYCLFYVQGQLCQMISGPEPLQVLLKIVKCILIAKVLTWEETTTHTEIIIKDPLNKCTFPSQEY